MNKITDIYTEVIPQIDLVREDWRILHKDEHYWENNAIVDSNDDIDTFAPFLTEKPGSAYEKCAPLSNPHGSPSKDYPLLFKEFTDLDGTPESFLLFANKYGLLGKAQQLKAKDTGQPLHVFGESLLFWQYHHWLAKSTLKVWEWIRTDNNKNLSLMTKQVNEYEFSYQIGQPEDLEIFISKKYNYRDDYYTIVLPYFRAYFRYCWTDHSSFFILHGKQLTTYSLNKRPYVNNPKLAAVKTIQSIVNNQLFEYPTKPIVFYDHKRNVYHQSLIPDNLLAAIWLQISQYLSGEKKIKQCPICRRWSDVTNVKGSWIKHRECANWDRVTKSRKLPRILELYNQGTPVYLISDELNIEHHHIERWINEEKAGV